MPGRPSQSAWRCLAIAVALSILSPTMLAVEVAQGNPASTVATHDAPGAARMIDEVQPGVVPELSTETSTTVRNPDGSFTSTMHAAPVNFRDDDGGGWLPISNDLVDAPGDAYAVQNEANSYTVSIPEDLSTTPVRFEVDGAWVKMRVGDADEAEPQIDGSEASFDNVAGADGISYEATDVGVKETIILESVPDTAPSFRYTLRTSPGLTPVLTVDGTVEFRTAGGEVAFVIPIGTMTDSAVPEPAYSDAVDYELASSGSAWTFKVIPRMTWLSDPARVYPVLIDPSLNTFVQKSCWLQEESPATTHCGENKISVGNSESGKKRRGLVDFNINAIPSAATITSATANLWLNPGWTTGSGGATSYALFNPSQVWGACASWGYTCKNGGTWSGGGSQGQISTFAHSLGGSSSGDYKSWTITSRVQGWVNGTYENRGVMIRQVDPETTKKVLGFVSETNLDTSKRPYMTVVYTLPPASVSIDAIFYDRSASDPEWDGPLTTSINVSQVVGGSPVALGTVAVSETGQFAVRIPVANLTPSGNSAVIRLTAPALSHRGAWSFDTVVYAGAGGTDWTSPAVGPEDIVEVGTGILAKSQEPESTGGGRSNTQAGHVEPAFSEQTQADQSLETSINDMVAWYENEIAADEDPTVQRDPCPEEGCTTEGARYLAPTIYKEGAGNACQAGSSGCSSIGRKNYTCAAASVRNMVATAFSIDNGELHYEEALDIQPNVGLNGIYHIVDTLNAEFKDTADHKWKSVAPTGPRHYMALIVHDINKDLPVVQNVRTMYLPYFGGKDLTHYNMVYGYSRPDKRVGIAEEWDPVFTYGVLSSSYSKGNPFGEHDRVRRGAAYNAVHNSPNSALVR